MSRITLTSSQVFDRLLYSLGQDVFDTLSIWSAQVTWRAKGLATSRYLTEREWKIFCCISELPVPCCVSSSGCCLCLRTFCRPSSPGSYKLSLYLLLKSNFQVVTLNVAINSQNNALITLLVANNFTELKGHVFKKFDESTLLQVEQLNSKTCRSQLLQVVCADIVERFQMVVCLSLVTLQNLVVDGKLMNKAWLQDWGNMVVVVWCTELLVDWIKHAFITKFNKIEPDVYNRYRDVIWEHICNAWRLRQVFSLSPHVSKLSFLPPASSSRQARWLRLSPHRLCLHPSRAAYFDARAHHRDPAELEGPGAARGPLVVCPLSDQGVHLWQNVSAYWTNVDEPLSCSSRSCMQAENCEMCLLSAQS
eukprot:751856-Hanusia_phi.AAC.6